MTAYRTTPAGLAIQQLVDAKAAQLFAGHVAHHTAGTNFLDQIHDILPGVFLGNGDDAWAEDRYRQAEERLDHADRWRDEPEQCVRDEGGRPAGDLTRYGQAMVDSWMGDAADQWRHLAQLWVMVAKVNAA